MTTGRTTTDNEQRPKDDGRDGGRCRSGSPLIGLSALTNAQGSAGRAGALFQVWEAFTVYGNSVETVATQRRHVEKYQMHL